MFCHLHKHQGAFNHEPDNPELKCRSMERAARGGEAGEMGRDPQLLMTEAQFPAETEQKVTQAAGEKESTYGKQ